MYVPAHDRPADPDFARALVARHPFGQLSTATPRLASSRLPLLWLEPDPPAAPLGRVVGHLARANPHAAELDRADEALLDVLGPQAYVSPSDYASTDQVPTWIYQAVQLRGRLRVLTGPDAVATLHRLVATFERTRAEPWTLDEGNPRHMGMFRAFTVFEVVVSEVHAKEKIAANKSPADRARLAEALLERDDPDARVLAARLLATLEPRG